MDAQCDAKRAIALAGQRRRAIDVRPTELTIYDRSGVEPNVVPNVGKRNDLSGIVVQHQLTPVAQIAEHRP